METNATDRRKRYALISHLSDNLDVEDFELPTFEDLKPNNWGEYETPHGDFMVLTDEEANEKAREYITESLWAFNPSFLASYAPDGVTEDIFSMLQDKCEGANSAFLGLVGDNLEGLIEDAIAADGRGHFLNTYDGDEHEIEVEDGMTYSKHMFYVYRTN